VINISQLQYVVAGHGVPVAAFILRQDAEDFVDLINIHFDSKSYKVIDSWQQ